MRKMGGSFVIAALVIVFLGAHARGALAAQTKPLTKVVSGYGSSEGGVSVLWFAKETKLFEKHGLDVVLVGMGAGSVSLRALIAHDLERLRPSQAQAWCKPRCKGPTQSLSPPRSTALFSRFLARRKLPARPNSKAKN